MTTTLLPSPARTTPHRSTGHPVRRSTLRGQHLAAIGAVATVAFAIMHVYWAFGGRVGVPSSAEPIGQRPVFLAYDVVSAVILFAAAGIAVAIARGHAGSRLMRLTFLGACVAVARGAVGVVQDAGQLAQHHSVSAGAVFDLWFLGVGVLFVVVVRELTRERRGLRRMTA